MDITKLTHGYWWHAKEKYRRLISERRPPRLLELTIQVTDRCNLACEKCNKTSFTGGEMPWEQVKSILDQAFDLGLIHIHLTGGECTLHPDLPKMIHWCKERKVRVDLSSNGKFSEDRFVELKEAGLNSINVSWDWIAQPPECMSFLAKYAPFGQFYEPRMFINHMVMPSNFQELPAFLQHIKDNVGFISDIQLMPPRGTADKFTYDQIADFNLKVAPRAYEISLNRFPMVEFKVQEMLGPLADLGVYHPIITWPCYRANAELRVGCAGYSPCTYLYRDGYIVAPLTATVKEAWEASKNLCKKTPPVLAMCDCSCSPEVCGLNMKVHEEMATRYDFHRL
jgi:hypothetical protein